MGRSRRSFILKQRLKSLAVQNRKKSLKPPFTCPICGGRSLFIDTKKLEAFCVKCKRQWKFPEPSLKVEIVDYYCGFCDAIYQKTAIEVI